MRRHCAVVHEVVKFSFCLGVALGLRADHVDGLIRRRSRAYGEGGGTWEFFAHTVCVCDGHMLLGASASHSTHFSCLFSSDGMPRAASAVVEASVWALWCVAGIPFACAVCSIGFPITLCCSKTLCPPPPPPMDWLFATLVHLPVSCDG